MTVRTSDGAWVVPTHRAVWIPATVPHTITMSGTVAMRTLYLRPLGRALPRDCCVVSVSRRLKELILHACTFTGLKKSIRAQRHLIDVILDQLQAIPVLPLQLPNPSDPRALRIAEVLPRKTRLTHLESVRLSSAFFIPMGGPQAHLNSVESRG